jgi:glutathione S-transferase
MAPLFLPLLSLLSLLLTQLSALLPPRVSPRISRRSSRSLTMKHILYDVPVSNHGARIRMIIQLKGIQDIEIRSPLSLGGLKSPDFVRLNPEGKMPVLLVEGEGEGDLYPIVESDPIARFLLDRYNEGPSLRAGSEMQRCLGEQLVRVMDQYIGPLQVGV